MKLKVRPLATFHSFPRQRSSRVVYAREVFPGLLSALTAAALGAILLALLPTERASAHGDAVEIFRGRQGAYEVIVRVLPETPAVGTIHFSITPLEVATMLPVENAKIVIIADDPQGKPTYQARALNRPATPDLYEASIKFESAGSWTLRVVVRTEELGETTVTVPLYVEEQSIPPGTAGGFVFLAVFLVLIGGGIYIWYSARRRRVGAQT